MAEAETNPSAGVNVDEAAAQIAALDMDFNEDQPRNRDRLESGDDVEDTDEQPVTDSDEEVTDQVDDVEAEEEVEETTDEAESTDTETDEDTDEESEDFIQNLAEFAEATEIPLEQLLSLETTAKVDGQEVTITLQEALNGFQRQSDYTQSTQALAEERKAFQAESLQAREVIERNNAVMANVMQQLQQMVVAPPDPAEMNRLRVEDTAEYNARLLEYQQKSQMFQQVVATAAQQYDAFHSQNQDKLTEQASEFLKAANEEMAKEVPGWNTQMRDQLQEWAGQTYGFSSDEMKLVVDPRTLRMARDAQAYREMRAKESETQKVLRKAPKLKAPGKKRTRSKAQLRADQVRSAKMKLQSSGRVQDAAAAIEQVIQDW